MDSLWQWFSKFLFALHTDFCGLPCGLYLLWCHFQLPGDLSGLCGSVSKATVCSNKLFFLLRPGRGNWTDNSLLETVALETVTEPISSYIQPLCSKLLQHTCGPSMAHQCVTALWLKITALRSAWPVPNLADSDATQAIRRLSQGLEGSCRNWWSFCWLHTTNGTLIPPYSIFSFIGFQRGQLIYSITQSWSTHHVIKHRVAQMLHMM